MRNSVSFLMRYVMTVLWFV